MEVQLADWQGKKVPSGSSTVIWLLLLQQLTRRQTTSTLALEVVPGGLEQSPLSLPGRVPPVVRGRQVSAAATSDDIAVITSAALKNFMARMGEAVKLQ